MGDGWRKQVQAAMGRMLTTLEQKVEPRHAALIVVDLQNDFCAEGGMVHKEGRDIRPAQAIVPRVVHLIDKAREAGVTVVYIQNVYSSQSNWYLSDVWLEQARRARKGPYVEYSVCEKGSWEGDFYDGIKPQPSEFIVNKHRYSAFIDTDLDLILRSRGIRTLIMTGTATNVCVESTARDGFMKDYYVVFLEDCTATGSGEVMHNNTLDTIASFFGQVADSAAVIQCWQGRKGGKET
ncbi:MAG: isochorismatase family protein [Chloroflexi bacterium]|nr:isochorismatase family protein [Chloroflexota bacterium]